MIHFWGDMKKAWFSITTIISISICVSMLIQVSSYAEKRTVEIDNHTIQNDTTENVSGITIYGLTRPCTGESLDEVAEVKTTEGKKWDIPVLWVDDANFISTNCIDGHTYLPVLSFYIPQGYALMDGQQTITLSDDIVELVGSQDVISTYDASKGITYILPASLKNLFVTNNPSRQEDNKRDNRTVPDILPFQGFKGTQDLVNAVNLLKDKVAVLEAKDLRVADVKVKSRKGRKALITWKKNKQASGYQIRYSTRRDFKKTAKNVSVSKASTRKKWLKKLQVGKTYYVKVRTVKTFTSAVTGKKKTVYGRWSATRRFKAKK